MYKTTGNTLVLFLLYKQYLIIPYTYSLQVNKYLPLIVAVSLYCMKIEI